MLEAVFSPLESTRELPPDTQASEIDPHRFLERVQQALQDVFENVSHKYGDCTTGRYYTVSKRQFGQHPQYLPLGQVLRALFTMTFL